MRHLVPAGQFRAIHLASATRSRMQPWEAGLPSARTDELVGPFLAEVYSTE